MRVATTTPGAGSFPYDVIRKPRSTDFLRLLRWCDVHVQANVSLKYIWPRLLFPSKTVYQHQVAYQRDDGHRGPLDILKATIARYSQSIACSRYVAKRTGARHTIRNAYDDYIFRSTRHWSDKDGDLVFLGRLVSQKGCDNLIGSLVRLREKGLRPQLTIIGDGPDRSSLTNMCEVQGLSEQVRFVGSLQGTPLAEELNRHRIMIVPSRYEEPFGIVALEGLACGCLPVVSERGGLVDAVGQHGITFMNGDEGALTEVLAHVLTNPDTPRLLLKNVDSHLRNFRARAVAEEYLELFRQYTAVT